jgi:hypothetical protein
MFVNDLFENKKITEGSVQDRLHRRHQELRKKSGLPDPDYYKELKASYGIEDDAKRIAAQAEIKKKYKVAEQDAYANYALNRAKGDMLQKEINPDSPQQNVYVSPSYNKMVSDLTTNLDYKNPDFAKKRAVIGPSKQTQTDAQLAAQLESVNQGTAEIKKKYKVAEANVKKPQPYNEPGWTKKLSKQELDAIAGYNEKSIKDIKKEKQDKKPVKENTGVTKHNDYDRWSDEVAAAGGEIHPQRDRVRMVAQSWDGETIGEFHMGTNQGWLMSHGQQGVAEDFDDTHPYDSYVSAKRTVTSTDGNNKLSDKTASIDTDRFGNQRVRAVDGDKLTINANIPKGVNVKMSPQQGDADKNVKEGIAEGVEQYLEEMRRAGYDIVTERATLCPECGGTAYADQMLAEKQDACYSKVKSRYKVWPSAYASGALVRCRKVGAKNWGNKSKK